MSKIAKIPGIKDGLMNDIHFLAEHTTINFDQPKPVGTVHQVPQMFPKTQIESNTTDNRGTTGHVGIGVHQTHREELPVERHTALRNVYH